MQTINYSEMTSAEIKDFTGEIHYKVRDYIFLHFLNAQEVVKKSTLAKRIFLRYERRHSIEMVASVIKDYISKGVLIEVEDNKSVKISTIEETLERDLSIISNRKKLNQ